MMHVCMLFRDIRTSQDVLLAILGRMDVAECGCGPAKDESGHVLLGVFSAWVSVRKAKDADVAGDLMKARGGVYHPEDFTA